MPDRGYLQRERFLFFHLSFLSNIFKLFKLTKFTYSFHYSFFDDLFRSIIKFSEQALDAGMRASFFSPRLMEVLVLFV
jgi:hypothetical protein